MYPYVLLMFVPLLFSFIAYTKNTTENIGKKTLKLGFHKEIMDHSLMIPVFFILFTALLMLRDETIGRDLLNYKYYFELYETVELKTIFEEKVDFLFWLLVWVVRRLTDDYQVFIAIVSFLTVLPIAVVYCQDRETGFLKIVLFMNMTTFIMFFSGLRQSLAIAMGLIAYEYVKKKKPIKFILIALIAMGFHHTGFMILFFYPLYHYTIKRSHMWVVIPAVLAIFAFNKPIFTWATNLLSTMFGDRYNTTIADTGAYTTLVLLIVFALFAYLLPDEKTMDKETLGLRNFLLVAVILQCFAPVHALAMRMNYYYLIFIPILMPKLLKNVKANWNDVAWLAKGSMIAFFVIYYLVDIYQQCQSGVSALDTYPYKFFWE